MAENLLTVLSKLTEKDFENIALAIRRCGPPNNLLTDYPHYLKAAKEHDKIGLLNREEVIAILRKAASTYPEVRHTIRKLQK